MNANELADELEACFTRADWVHVNECATMLRQQQAEIEDLKNANRFIQNFAEEQHKRSVALEMRELTDEEINEIVWQQNLLLNNDDLRKFARAILRKAQEK